MKENIQLYIAIKDFLDNTYELLNSCERKLEENKYIDKQQIKSGYETIDHNLTVLKENINEILDLDKIFKERNVFING